MAITRINDSADDQITLTLSNGDIVDLVFSEDRIIANAKGEAVGEFNFALYEIPYGTDGEETIARLTHAFLEGHNGRYKRHGIGTAAVRFFISSTGYTLDLPENDGLRKTDGSHLVDDGPAFVKSLREKLRDGKL